MSIFISVVIAWFIVGYFNSKRVTALFDALKRKDEYRSFARWVYDGFEEQSGKKFEFSRERFYQLLPGVAAFVGAWHGPFINCYVNWLLDLEKGWRKYTEEQDEKLEQLN